MNESVLKDHTLCYAWNDGKGDQVPPPGSWVYKLGINTLESYRSFSFKWFRASIESAKKLGYRVAIYLDKKDLPLWEDFSLIDELVEVPKDFYPHYYDSFKYYAPYTRDDVISIDHDIIMHNRLPEKKEDVVGDVVLERWSLHNKRNDLEIYEKHNVQSVIPEWDYMRENKSIPCVNTGLLHFNNLEFKKLFFERWDAFHEFCSSNKIFNYGIHMASPTAFGSEVFLGILAKVHGLTAGSWHNIIQSPNQTKQPFGQVYYKHYVGDLKFTHRDLVDKYDDNKINII